MFSDYIPNIRDWKVYLVCAYALLFLALLVFINGAMSDQLQSDIIEQKDQQIKNLEAYSHQIELLYSELRGFKHDYLNILSSLKVGIDRQDLAIISKVYDDVLEKTKVKLGDSRFEMSRLINVRDEAVKGILYSKLSEAENLGLAVSIEVVEPFQVSEMNLLDFITILSIFIDNAIEASNQTTEKIVVISLISGQFDTVIVENSITEENINSLNLFSLGYSEKGEGRGIGLANVRDILESYPKCTLKTQSKNHRFRQTLIIG